MRTVNIFALDNGVGISRDMKLLQSALISGGYKVVISPMYRYTPTLKYDINIFLERFNPRFLDFADLNVFIPNQEWFDKNWLPFLDRFQLFLTKSKFADKIFQVLGCTTEYISFTSEDRYLPDVNKDYTHWLHVAGKSIQKQTDMVIRTWQNNSGFPQLTVVQDPKHYKPRPLIRNVNMMFDRLPDDTLKHMQNSFGVHVCPSETEGFGHYINEGSSCKAVVITTNGAPMNELITPERGILVDPSRQEPMPFSTKFIVSEAALEKAVVKAMVMEDSARESLGTAARQFFLDNDAFFKRRVVEAINNLT